MTEKQFYLNMIYRAISHEDEETVNLYRQKLNNLLKEECEETIKKAKTSE